MDSSKKNLFARFAEKLLGGLRMSWVTVLLLALGSAVLTALFLIVPVFKNTSFERMGVTYEAWIFLAVVIMSNCKAPLESAVKTFVFFLVSQPLIYLFQVPFSWLGWGVFGYYRFWFILTLLTFPAAFVGWYLTKKNWLSALILAPVLAYLGVTAYQCATHSLRHFPLLLCTALFCLMQIALYLAAFLPGKKKLVGLAVPLLAAAVLALTARETAISSALFLPDDPVLTEEAVVLTEDGASAAITVERTGEDSMIRVQTETYGATDFTIRDGERVYRYTAEVYEDEGGHPQIRITARP